MTDCPSRPNPAPAGWPPPSQGDLLRAQRRHARRVHPAALVEFDQALTPLECERIVDFATPRLSPDALTATIWNREARPTTGPVAHLFDVLLPRLATANEMWRLTGLRLCFLQALRYTCGESHPWHADGTLDPSWRWIGAVVYLSDPAHHYRGGELELESGRLLRPPVGSVILLPGHIGHRVRAVTAGVRWVVTAFAAGDGPPDQEYPTWHHY